MPGILLSSVNPFTIRAGDTVQSTFTFGKGRVTAVDAEGGEVEITWDDNNHVTTQKLSKLNTVLLLA